MPRTLPGATACGYAWVKRKLRTGVVTSPFSISHTPLRVRPVTTSGRGSNTRVYQKSVTSSPRRTPLTRASTDASAAGPAASPAREPAPEPTGEPAAEPTVGPAPASDLAGSKVTDRGAGPHRVDVGAALPVETVPS